jgi:hypothetical protein
MRAALAGRAPDKLPPPSGRRQRLAWFANFCPETGVLRICSVVFAYLQREEADMAAHNRVWGLCRWAKGGAG